jgi:two-component system cell cycle response regulator DivK
MHRILVVEDNAINRELLCDWLEVQGYAVLSAEDVGGAERLLNGQQPDAVLLDVQLGSEDGLSLAAWMRRQPGVSGIPVIAVTAHAMVTEQQRFLKSGCNACISKPIDFKVLQRELDKWLAPVQKLSPRA